METFVTYKLPELVKLPLFLPPPYCRKAEKAKASSEDGGFEEVPVVPSLKLIASNPAKLLTLNEKLTDNSSKALEVKINKYFMKEGASKLSFLIHFVPATEQALVQVVGQEELETSLRVCFSEEMMKHFVQYEHETLKCNETMDPQILHLLKKIFSPLTCSVVLVPILRKERYYPCATESMLPALLVCFVNSQMQEDDLTKLANELFKYSLPVLLNLMAAEEATDQKRVYESLLTVVRRLFSYLEDIHELFKAIKDEARKLTYSQKCSLFLTNPEHVDSVGKVFNISTENRLNPKVKITKDHAIPEHVVSSGKLLNLESSCDLPQINKSLTEISGFATRNILCCPMRNENEIIGAIQLCNKIAGNFTHFDEEIVNAFGFYCGLSITNCLKYMELVNFKMRNEIGHFKYPNLYCPLQQVDEAKVEAKLRCPLIHIYHGFSEFSFDPREVVEIESVCFVLKMFEELGFFAIFNIKKCVFIRFVMHIKQGCRDVPYHNWMHLFSTAHFAYLCLKNLSLVGKRYITPLEAMAYFISCLCHDVDYRGTNNPFQEKPNSALASLYSSSGSIMERHRLSQILRILAIEGCNFLEVFDRENYSLFVKVMKDSLLATDLAAHIKFSRKQYDMTRRGYNRNNSEHRYVFVSLLTTCADLSDHTKEWPVARKVAGMMFDEFFTRGDLDRQIENLPAKMTDLESVSLPDYMIELLKEMCLPCFKLLAAMFVETKILVRKIKRNILCWEASKHILKKATDEARSCLEVLASENFDKEVEDTLAIMENQQ